MTMRKFTTGLCVSAAVLLAACGQDDRPESTGKTLATVNGIEIRQSEMDAQLKGIPANLLQGREDQIQKQLLERLIEKELVRQEAEELNIEEDEAYEAQLDAYEAQLRTNFVIQRKLKEALTEDVLRNAYEQTKAARTFPAVKARHILVKTEKEAKDLLKVATPANFADLAKEKSTGPSAANGGELGWFRKEAMVPEFATAAFATNANTIASKPVKTQFGWHVIFVEDKNDKYVPSFEQTQQALRAELSQAILQGYVADMRKNATVTYSDAAENKETEAENADQ